MSRKGNLNVLVWEMCFHFQMLIASSMYHFLNEKKLKPKFPARNSVQQNKNRNQRIVTISILAFADYLHGLDKVAMLEVTCQGYMAVLV